MNSDSSFGSTPFQTILFNKSDKLFNLICNSLVDISNVIDKHYIITMLNTQNTSNRTSNTETALSRGSNYLRISSHITLASSNNSKTKTRAFNISKSFHNSLCLKNNCLIYFLRNNFFHYLTSSKSAISVSLSSLPEIILSSVVSIQPIITSEAISRAPYVNAL